MLASVSLAVGLILSSAAPAQTESVRALVVQYADGRRSVAPLSTSGRSFWTTAFPRIPDAVTDRDALPLRALDVRAVPESTGVAVAVALLYGSPHQKRIEVATIHLSGAQPVAVVELEAFGVKPVQFSLASLPSPSQLPLPSVTSPSSSLEISMETVGGSLPGYNATIVNHSAQAVMMLAFQAYRGNVKSVSGMPRGFGKTPLIPPNGTYVLKVNVSAPQEAASPSGWLAVDRVEITSVLWNDGLVEGHGEPAAREHALDAGTALELDRIVAALGAAAADPAGRTPGQLKDTLAALDVTVTLRDATVAGDAIPGPVSLSLDRITTTMRQGMQNAKDAALKDVDELVRPVQPPPAEYAAWLSRTIAKYDGWRRRIRE